MTLAEIEAFLILAEELHFGRTADRLHLGLDEATAAARGVAGTLRVGFTTTTEQTLVHDLVRSFDERYPDCEVVAIEVPVTDRYRSLRSTSSTSSCTGRCSTNPT